ncbi:MAG: hypothetical protein K5681_00590 [Treponema sp.]|nr:hypothetical protein [Treponema sp.]
MKKNYEKSIDDLYGFTDICDSEKGLHTLVGAGCAEEAWGRDAGAETQGERNKGKNGLYGFPEGPHDTVKAPFNIIKN